MLKEREIVMVDWKTPGKKVAGYLLSVTRNKYRDGSVGLTYTVRNELGTVLIFKGATQLNYALSPADKGKWIEVTYVGEDATREVADGINRPKLFRVAVDEERSMAAATEHGITDEDIPF
jgi:hypothetical protein